MVLSFKLLFKGSDPLWILDLVASSHVHGLDLFLTNSDLLLQRICSNLIIFYCTLYLKVFNSLPIGTSLEELQNKLSASMLLTHSSNFAISVLFAKVSHQIKWKTWQQVQDFWLSLTHTVHSILLLASLLSSSSDPKRSMSASSLLSVAPLPVVSSA